MKDGDLQDQRGRHSGNLKRTPEVIDSVRKILADNKHVTIDEIVDIIGLSHGTVFLVLHDDLGLSKKAAR